MAWFGAYVVLLAVLVVRFVDPDARPRIVAPPAADEPLALVRWHHRAVALVLIAAPLEALFLGGAPAGRFLGLGAMAAGVALYRWGARTLGDAVSPFLSPAPGAEVVRRGPYAFVRHPMYLGQMLIVGGAPLVLGARVSLVASAVAVGVIAYRMAREERLLRVRLAGYEDYAAETARVLPWVL